MEKPLQTLHKSLLANNFDVPEDYDSFEQTLSLPGDKGYQNRHTLWQSLKDNNFDVPDNYDDFRDTLFGTQQKSKGMIAQSVTPELPAGVTTEGALDSVIQGLSPKITGHPSADVQPLPRVVNPFEQPTVNDNESVVEKTARMLKGQSTPEEEKAVQQRIQQRMDEIAYEKETGKRLRKPVLDTVFEAPTMERDENGNSLIGNTTDQDRVSTYYQVLKERADWDALTDEEKRNRIKQMQTDMEDDEYKEPDLLTSTGKKLGSGFLRLGVSGFLNMMQGLSSGLIVEDASSPTGYTKTEEYNPEKNTNSVNRGLEKINQYIDKMSREGEVRRGQGLTDLIMDGDIMGAVMKTWGIAAESAPMMLSIYNPYTMILAGMSMAGSNFRQNTIDNPDIPEGKRAAMAIGSAAIEMIIEKFSDPVFKHFNGGRALSWFGKKTSEETVKKITQEAESAIANRIISVLKDAGAEGLEEVATNFGNDVLGQALDWLDGSSDYGITAQWRELQKRNPNANLQDFAMQKAKENLDSFLGGAMAGAYTSGLAQVSSKAMQYTLGNNAGNTPGLSIDPVTMNVASSFDEGFASVKQDEKEQFKIEAQQAYDQLSQYGEDFVKLVTEAESPAVAIDYMVQHPDTYTQDQVIAANNYFEAQARVDGMQEAENDVTGKRTERRQAAYDRGANISEEQLAGISYDAKLANAHMMETMPDGSQQESVRKQIMQAVESGDMEGAEAILAQQTPYLNEQQREAIESYLDAHETDNGVTDAVENMIAQYEEEKRAEYESISDAQGNITPMILKDGSYVYYQSGDLNGFRSQVIVVDFPGAKPRAISTSDIEETLSSMSVDESVAISVDAYGNDLRNRYTMLANGSMLDEGQQADIVMGNQLFHVTALGQDESGNTVIQMEDGSRMAITPDQLSEAINAADTYKIEQTLQEEKQTALAQQQTERFNQGIVGFAEGTPDLTAKDTKPEVAAEYLLSQTNEQGQPTDRKVVLDDIQNKVDELNNSKLQTLTALQQANNDMAMADDAEADVPRQHAEQLESQISAIDAQRRKWGEIRQAMMTDEERQAFEKDRFKAVSSAKTQSKKDVASDTEAIPQSATQVPTAKELVAQYPERGDGETFVEEQRKQLSQQYRNDVYPTWDNIQKRLDDYQHGLSDLSPEEIKQLTDEQARLEALMSQMVDQQNAWKKLSSDLGREYGKMERQQMTPHEQAMQRLQNETDKAKKIKLAKEAFKDDQDTLAILDNMDPQDVNEWVAANLGTGTINWEGIQRGEHYVRGLRDEMGKDKTRGIGAGFDTNGFNQFLAPEGQGKGIDEIVHDISEGSPYDPQDVKNALLSMLTEATKPTDISNYIENARIAQAENIYKKNLEREHQAEMEFEDDAIRQTTGLEPEEYDAMIDDLERRLAEQEGFENSDDYFKYVEEYEQREIERSTGGSQEESSMVVQGQEGKQAGPEETVSRRADAADVRRGVREVQRTVDNIVNDVNEKQAETENDVTLQQANEQWQAVLDEANGEIDLCPSMIVNEESDLQALKNNGVAEQFLDLIREDLADEATIGRFVPELGMIFFYTEKMNRLGMTALEKKAKVYHENVHALSKKGYTPADFEETAKLINDEYVMDEIINAHKDQSEDVQNEEVVSYFIEGIIAGGPSEEFLNGTFSEASPELNERLNEISKILKNESRQNQQVPARVELGETPVAETQQGAEPAAATGEEGKVNSPIQGLDGYTENDVTDLVRQHFADLVGDTGVEIVDMKVIGSRINGKANEDSDLDVLLEYKGDMKEDNLFNILNNEEDRLYIEGIPVDINPITQGKSGTIAEFLKRNADYTKGEELMHVPFADRLKAANGETNTNPTEAQKKAGNYKMGHVRFGGYRMSIENPKGSTRSGVDANGKPWSIEMQDTYGYIGQKYGVDGDHLDFFINDDADLDNWNGRVYVVDQKNEDGTFDEHKVMYGYPNWSAARKAYERNYEPGWWANHVMQMTGMPKEDFDKWLNDSDHKRKPFAEYSRTREADTVSSPVDQLLADIDDRQKTAEPQQSMKPMMKEEELKGKSIDELRQLRKKEMQDRSMAKVMLGTTDAIKGTDKEKTLENNIIRAEANIAIIDNVLGVKTAENKKRIDQLEIGGAMVDRLEGMGFDVTTNLSEMRKVRKQAEQDNSEEGKMRHFETPDGKIYGFTYKGKMYLDPRKIDAELPIHEYAHPWCEAMRRLNPENWKSIVDLMKGDKDTWEFVKQLNPDIKDENDIAEEMIAKFSGKKGAERAQAEFERMNQRDPDYKSKWGNIWQNISKAIQDFWKQVGDFLHIKYKSAEQVYDQVVRDFANSINPRKRVEDWLKERDKEYLDAVERGDNAKAKELFDAALRENIGNGITPYVSAGGYRGKMQQLAHGVKTRDAKVIAEVADLMTPLIPKDAVLIPAPSHTGKATDMLDLANAISERTGAPVADVLTSAERGSQYEAKYAGAPIASKDMGITLSGKLPEGKMPVVIDNVVDTGNTAEACIQALGKGIVASLADSADRYGHVASLKSAEPVVVSKNGKVVPLSKRFEIGNKWLEKGFVSKAIGEEFEMPQFMIEEGSLFNDSDFEESAAVVEMPMLNKHGLNEQTLLGKRLTELKKQAGPSGLVGYITDDAYVFVGDSAKPVTSLNKFQGVVKGEQDGMTTVSVPTGMFDRVSPKLVKDGYKMAFLGETKEEQPINKTTKKEPVITENSTTTTTNSGSYNVGDKFDIIDDYGKRFTVEVVDINNQGEIIINAGDYGIMPPLEIDVIDEYRRRAEEPVASEPAPVDKVLEEADRRKEVAENKKAADEIIKKYLSEKPTDKEEQVRQRATKAVLTVLDNAGVPFKVVSKEEEKEILRVFSMMNQEVIKDFARRPSIRSMSPHGFGRYIVYNMNTPFGVPMYFEKMSTAKYGLEQMQRMAPEGDWAVMDIGYADEIAEQDDALKKAAEMQADIETWHGSGAVFTKFDHSHMSEGAGSQVFGWGTYLTDNQNIGTGYATNVSNRNTKYTYKGEEVAINNNPLYMAAEIMTNSKNKRAAIQEAEYMKSNVLPDNEKRLKLWDDIIGILKESQKKDFAIEHPTPTLYKVDIPDDTGENYLDWMITIKKPLRRKIADAVRKLDGEPQQSFVYANYKNGWESLADMIEREQWAYKEIHDRLLMAFGGRIKDAEKVSKLMNSLGFVGVKYPAGTIMGGGNGATNYVIFNEDDAKIVESIQFMIGDDADVTRQHAEQPIFVSNALQAVEGIKQEKATPEQWLKMIEKAGGMKAAEDKWLGLRTQLEDAANMGIKSVTKDAILNYIRDHQVQVEETHYSEFDEEGSRRLADFNKEFDTILDKLEKERNAVNAETEAFNQEMYEKYGQGWANDHKQLSKEDRQRDRHISNRYSFLNDNDLGQLAFADMVEKYGDDFGDAFEVSYNGEHYELIPNVDFYDEPTDAAKHFLHTQNVINGTRLVYTTDGLDHKREIALTVPTIEPYNESDSVHFGDAGGGRAVAWIRFGDTVIEQGNSVGHQAAKRRMDAYYDYLVDKYGYNDDPLAFAEKLTPEESAEMSRLEAEYDKTFSDESKKVLVIDEIQSKRHQDARNQGYRDEAKIKELEERYDKLVKDEQKITEREKVIYDEIAKSEEVKPLLNEEGNIRPDAKQQYDEIVKNNKKLQALNYNWRAIIQSKQAVRDEITYEKYNGVPDAPFEKNWHELAMKRMLRYAAENGYDKIAWTTGEQQAERYDLGGVIDSINAYPHSDPMTGETVKDQYDVFVKGTDGSYIHESGMAGLLTKEQILQNFGKDLGARIIEAADAQPDGTAVISGDGLRIGGEGMKGFYDDMLVRFMNKYGKKWGVKVEQTELPGIGQTMWSIDVTPEMKESVMQGQPMFHKAGKQILGWSDGKQVFLTQAGLNPNTPLHECTHMWDKWCAHEHPDLWKKLVAAMKKTAMWEEIAKNPNYRNIWNDEDMMASEVHSRLSGATGEDEFMKAAFKKNTPQSIINEVKNVLKKFWEAVLRLFNKHTKTISDDFNSLESIIRMPILDLVNQDFEKVMNVAESLPSGQVEGERGKMIVKTLMGVHNISEDKLKKAIKQGGLANPSLAVIDTKGGYVHTDYGGISLIPKASLIDSKTGRNAGTFTADAWTPSYPPVELVMKNKGWDKFFADLKDIRKNADGGDELASRLRVYIESYLEQRDPDAMYWWYMYDRGLNPATVRRTNPYDKTLTNRIVELTGGDERTSVGSLSDDAIKEIAELYHNYKTANKEELKPLGERISDTKQRINPEDTNKMRQLRLQEILDYLEKYGETKSNLNDFISSINLSARRAGEVDDYTTFSDARKAVISQGKEADFQKWLEELNARYGIEEKIFNGWTNNGDKKYIPNTLENVSRYMKRQGLNGATNWSSMGSWIATVANKEKTLEGIRKHRKNLGTPEAEHDAFREKWGEIFFPIVQKLGKGDVFNGDNVMKDILEHTDFAGYLKREYGMELTKEEKESIDTFIKEVRTNFPTGYFETKFERPVMLDEFEIAVVPENTSPDVVEALKNAGLDVRTYDNTGSLEQQIESRRVAVMDAVGMRNDILFHIEDNDDTIARLEREPKEIGYRNVVLNEDGTLGSPMANRLGKKGVGRKATTPFEYGKWERSDEHPELATEDGKIDLIKPGNKEVGGVDYNPYIHIRPTKVNKQFKQAWERPNLIYVETEYPKSELEGNYQAEKAALPVGKHPWGGGELILSRWDKPVRMVPWEEVADDWEKEFADRGVEFDIVPPALLPILAERGVEILPPHKGMGKACKAAYEAWKNSASQQNMYRRGSDIENVNAKFNKALGSLSDKSVLKLGNPSEVLVAAGIKNKPMKLYGTKLLAKAKKHGYKPEDIKDLPLAVASPLAVFTGSHPDSFAILTVLNINGNNVLVTISPNSDTNDVDFNIISSVYDKKADSVLHWINNNKGLYYDKEKALDYLRHSTPIVETSGNQELDSAAKIIKDFENPKLLAEKLPEIYPEYTDAAEQTGSILGGTNVIFEVKAPEAGTLGWYDPNDGSVHVVIPAHNSVDEVNRTVCHEKLGHEGLVALLGSQEAVDKFGSFIFKSAGKTLRKRIMAKADENDGMWNDANRFSKAAQEVFGDIAADGPRTEEEFSLWTKVKHYLIRLLNKLGLTVRGLLNDKDMSYYVLKTGEALKRWDKMSDEEKAQFAEQATDYDILRSRRGKPRKRNGESDAQYFQRLAEWEKWRAAIARAEEAGDPEPTDEQFHDAAEAEYKQALKQWKEQNGISDAELSAGSFPRREDGESPQDYAIRVQEYEAKNDLWKTAPQYMDFMRRASDNYRRAYTEWRERYDLKDQASFDQRLYEGDINPMPTFTDADEEAYALAEKELADAEGMEIDEEGAKRMAKLAVIERRKDFESSNAEDAIWVFDFMNQTDETAKAISERTGRTVTGKDIREALPFLIEADRRRENMEAEKEDAVMAINMSDAIQKAHSFMDFRNLEQIGEEVNALQKAWEYQENHPSGDAQQAYREAAARLADKLNELNKDYAGYNKLFADDIMQIRSLLVHATVAGGGEVMPPFAQSLEGAPEMKPLMEHIKDWYDEFYQVLEDAGLRGDAGYIEDGYVNHVWDKEKSDPKAWEQYIENRQRTKSPNMRHREIDTYMDGISIGLVPKYTDIANMISHYSRQNNETVANRHFLDSMRFVYVQELNSDGEVVAILPLLTIDKPDGMLRERYAQYYVPGVGDVYVMKHVQKRFANIFGTMRTPDAADWLSNMAKGYDLISSTAKKIQLALSGFHALALFEVDVAQNNPAVALKHLLKYIITDSYKNNTMPAYAHPEDFQFAAKHLVQLGATEDYAAADVNAITANIREYFKFLEQDDAAFKKAVGVIGSPAAIFMDWVNKGFDTVLWNYLHDGLKLCAFKELAKQVERRVEKEGLDEDMREKLLDEAGQYVNDMFGGQYFELLNVSPATLKWMRRFFLSPDWLISTQRHFFANFGFGSVYSDSGFRNYVKYNWDNIQRLFGKDIPHNELRRLRSKNAKYCYLVGAMFWWGLFYNGINALMRWLDEKDEKEKAEEIRKTNPDYKSPYELAYPDGMKWYDYTMWGNAIGQQTHLFTGRYADGTETYVRWGKQFREFPELFMGRYGVEFPAPLIQRMMSKANPNIGTMIDFLGAQNIGGFNGSYENKELREKYGKTIATLASTARHFIPFGMPTQADKEYKLMDFFMPSSKGFSRWKAKDYFETFILDGDWDGIDATYNACVMNGVDAEKALDAAIASIKATQKKELAGDITDLSTAVQGFDNAKSPEERAVMLNKLKKHLKDADYKVMTRQAAREKVEDFLEGDAAKENARYLMLVNSEDVIAEEHLKDLGRKAREYIKKVNSAPENEQEALENQYAVWYDINDIVREANKDIKEMKGLLGGVDDEKLIKDIRKTIQDAQKEIDQLQPPK